MYRTMNATSMETEVSPFYYWPSDFVLFPHGAPLGIRLCGIHNSKGIMRARASNLSADQKPDSSRINFMTMVDLLNYAIVAILIVSLLYRD